jgi:hypothetical protein
MSNLSCHQSVVERMLGDRCSLADVEDYIEGCALAELDKAALWMLALVRQEPKVQRRLVKEMLALASDMSAACL